MTRKSRSRSSQCATPLEVSMPPLRKTTAAVAGNNNKTQCRQIKDSTDKQCGVCEICKVEYDALTIHLKTKDHEYFARNTQNFIALDTLIQSSADVNKFLEENNAEAMEELDPLEQPLSISNLSPPLRERSKRSTKGKHSSEKFQNKRSKTTKSAPKTQQITPTKNQRSKVKANSSSPIRPFPPPSSLYKVVETSQVENTPRRVLNDTVTASPSLIVKIKKVRTSALLRLNGEAESFMFPKTQRRASSDLPTDVDRQSSSERIRNSIYSSSSLDSSSNSDIVVNLEPLTPTKRNVKAKRAKTTTTTTTQCFQSTPIQPNVQLKRLRKSNTTTPITNLADLSPPSAAAAIVAATAKISLPAATRKSSRMATAIVSAATTSSRLLRAAAEVVKKSAVNTRNNRTRSCRLSVVKMEDRMGDTEETNVEENTITKKVASSNTNKSKNLSTAVATPTKNDELQEDNYDDDDDDDDDIEEDEHDVEDDDKADKDFQYKCKKPSIKPRSRRGKRKKAQIKPKAKKVNNNKANNNKSPLHYDFTESELIKAQNYAFERVPESDLWYRVFKRQDNCEEAYYQYFANTQYHKLPYEMGPIPYTHTKLSTSCCKLCEPVKQEKELEPLIKTEAADNAKPYALKHKKLHLLQRYRQEQEALLKAQEQQDCYIKAESLASEVANGLQSDLERLERAGSTQSTSSSCASTSKKAAFRNKLLQKAALLSLDLPPRKSPREHASTLALVSIIKQRQESKPNSDAEEVTPKQETATPTPIEEICFATEISENVKRMRRGRNKYDHSPPYVLNKPKRLMLKKLNKTEVKTEKRLPKYVKYVNMLHSKNLSLPASVRKTGQKKGVLEFAVEESALKALDAELQPAVNVRKLERDIEDFLENTGTDLDMNELCTPPATEYFSSDFELCDLVSHANNSILVGGEEAQRRSRESKHLSVYNTMALQKYFRKRKYMKTNRTGWPKLAKKKYSMRHQTLIANELKKQSASVAKAVMTPPDSELDALHIKKEAEDTATADDVEVSLPEEGEEEEENEEYTVLECIENENTETAQLHEYEKAVEADDEDEFNEHIEKDIIEEEEEEEQPEEEEEKEEAEAETEVDPKTKRSRRNSSLGKALENCLINNEKHRSGDEQDMDMLSLIATTSTPSRNLARSSRRTPQLNGSLISCHSPTERAGDNSDIFTVSSDGLDTDLDLSNPHAHVKDEQSHSVTKYDITKYVKNPTANTCAAEAATAAVKSLAIAQFLKKEVRVTCRRIRAPFRRFRYRR